MSNLPNSLIDDFQRIVEKNLKNIAQLRMKILFGVREIRGLYGQKISFPTTGDIQISGLRVPVSNSDAATKEYVDTFGGTAPGGSGDVQSTMQSDLDANGYIIKDSTGSLTLASESGIIIFRKI